jgi:hypothetical protein
VTNTRLRARCADLQQSAPESYKAYQRGNYELYDSLASAYVWWRDCMANDGALVDDLCRAEGLRWQTRKDNRPNFKPMLLLLFKFRHPTPAERVMIGQWSQALLAVHMEVEQSPDDFRAKLHSKVVALFKSEGMVGLAARERDTEEADDDGAGEVDDGGPIGPIVTRRPKRVSETITDDTRAKIADRAVQAVTTGAGIGSVVPKEPPRVANVLSPTKKDIIVIPARVEANGSITLLGSTPNQDTVRRVASEVARHDLVVDGGAAISVRRRDNQGEKL